MKLFKLHYSETLIRRAVWSFWRRVVDWRFYLAMALVSLSFVSSLVSGDRTWRVGVSGAVLLLGILFAAAIYIVHFRRGIARFRSMKLPEASLEIGDERFRVTSDLGSSELPWSAITEVWQFPDFWLLFLSRAQFITLPLADLDAEARAFLLDRTKAHGAKIS
jgi:hypothetical protein